MAHEMISNPPALAGASGASVASVPGVCFGWPVHSDDAFVLSEYRRLNPLIALHFDALRACVSKLSALACDAPAACVSIPDGNHGDNNLSDLSGLVK